MSDGTIQIVHQGAVARLVIDRPARRNALSLAMWRAIPSALAGIASRPDVEAVVVKGAGEHFAAGADISELEAMVGEREAGLATMDAISAAEGALAALDKPTIAVIRGACIGGGLELAMACDIRLAATDSRFMAPPSRLGIAYSLASTRRLVALVGEGRATNMLLSPREIGAPEALAVGLVTAIHEPAELEAASDAYIERMVKHSLFSIMSAKTIIRAVREGHQTDTDVVRALRVRGFLEADFREGVAAFRERRRAQFSWGRASASASSDTEGSQS